MKKADFRTFYRGAHAVECLTEREKMLMGLAVAMMQLSLLTPNINMAIYGHMRKTGIAELKNNLSRYLDQVKSGETILVMDRNQPVAQIVPLPSAARGLVSDDDRLSRLERKGLIRRAVPGHNKWLAKHRPVKVKGSVLQGLLDERGSGW